MEDRSGVRVPAEFHQLSQQVRAIARLLNDYLRETAIDLPNSPARADLDLEPEFADDQLSDPVRHVALCGHRALVASVDHTLGLAACIGAEDVIFATVSLLRPIVTTAGLSYHILEQGIGIRERLRRGVNIELEAIREQLNSIEARASRDMWEEVAITRHRYLVWGRHHGYERRQRKDRNGETRYWLADEGRQNPALSEMRLAADVLGAVRDIDLGRTVYRFTSSFIHSQSHAFSFFLRATMQRDPQLPGVVPLGISLQDLTTWIMAAMLAVHTAAVRCGAYFSWDLTKWVATVHPLLSAWASTLRS